MHMPKHAFCDFFYNKGFSHIKIKEMQGCTQMPGLSGVGPVLYPPTAKNRGGFRPLYAKGDYL